MNGSFDPCSSNDREGETLIERETTFSGRASRLRGRERVRFTLAERGSRR